MYEDLGERASTQKDYKEHGVEKEERSQDGGKIVSGEMQEWECQGPDHGRP